MKNGDWKIWLMSLPVMLLCLFLLNSNCYAEVSAKEAQQIFNKMTPGGIVFNIKDSDVVQASSIYNLVTVYKGMLYFVKNKDELALVIGHELGHIAHRDSSKGTPTFADEYAADLYGFALANKLGYNGCRGISIFKRFKWTYAHPAGIDRYNKLNKYCKRAV